MDPSARLEPERLPVYEDVTLRVVVEPAEDLTAGSTVECQLPNSLNAGDAISPIAQKEWQTTDPEGRHFVSVDTEADATFDIRVERREFVGGRAIGTKYVGCIVAEVESGTVPASGAVTVSFDNTKSPWVADQNTAESIHEGLVFVRVDSERVKPSPTFEVEPAPAVYHRLIVPSSVAAGDPFRMLLVSLDPYNNVSSSSFEDVEVRTEDAVLAEGIEYTGRHEHQATLESPGVHRLTAEIPDWGSVTSNPVRVEADPDGPYWGDIHVHSDASVDAVGNTPYEYAKAASGLDFAASAEHGAIGLSPYWEQNRRRAREHNDPGEFVAIPAFETNMTPSFDDVRGVHMNVYLYDDIDHGPIERMSAGDSLVSAPELDAYLEDKDAITQIHHTGWGFDMRREYHETTDFFEIYSMHGTSELYDPESSIYMDKNRAKEGVASEGPYYARDAWALGQRFSTMGSSDNHFGQAGVRYNSVTAVNADELTRESVLDTMVAGQCYATTGERIILEFTIDGEPMGSELVREPGTDLPLSVNAYGTDSIETVEVFSATVLDPDEDVEFGDFRFDDGDERVAAARESWERTALAEAADSLDIEASTTLTADEEPTVHYVRVKQAEPIELPSTIEGQDERQVRDVYAWSTPIWIRPE